PADTPSCRSQTYPDVDLQQLDRVPIGNTREQSRPTLLLGCGSMADRTPNHITVVLSGPRLISAVCCHLSLSKLDLHTTHPPSLSHPHTHTHTHTPPSPRSSSHKPHTHTQP